WLGFEVYASLKLSPSHLTVFPLRCAVQRYAWGKLGLASEVAQLVAASDTAQRVEPEQPYAELWMGTHPKGDAQIRDDRVQPPTLSQWIAAHPDSLGSKVRDRFGDQLPFLFKVLSVNMALSIQAHPNKSHAEELHAKFPQHYPDANHKPEMAIALTPFEGLCGFRPTQEILDFLHNVPELRAVVGEGAAAELHGGVGDDAKVAAALKRCFAAVMTCDKRLFAEQLGGLVARVSKDVAEGKDTSPSLGPLLLRLHSQFPADVGCFVIYFLNHITLQPGEAMFLGANEPHAYLSGDCIECMACSDNTVRAGLTPKFIDVDTLCAMLHYAPAPAASKLFPARPDPSDRAALVYDPPVPDFTVIRIERIVPLKLGLFSIRICCFAIDLSTLRPRVVLKAAGRAVALGRGSVAFVSAGESVPLTVGPQHGLLMFRACALL
uniref:Mannose-6-phosphate isomerase n=1 Tax=Petromyzon marinus TaxID=7757 RepID=S4RGG1_PETMA